MEKYLIIVFILYLLVTVAGYWLDYLNLSHLKKYGAIVPHAFQGYIDQNILNKTRDYVVENTKFKIVSSVFHTILLIVFLFGGLLNLYNSWIVSLELPFILSGLVFFLLLFYGESLLSIPFDLYHTFKIENKYGFTTTTFKLWITDLVKSFIISTILVAILISTGLLIIQKSPHFWWLWVWCLFLAFGILMMYIYPYIIEPLFNKVTPVEDESLREGIRNLMQKVGLKIKKILKIDASKRTKHTNAYFTGIGKVKRIVLYDTLLEKMNNDEILSVLAHEIGHWKKWHLIKYLILSESIAFIGMYISYQVLQSDFLSKLFFITYDTFFVKVILLSFLGSIVAFPFTPVFNYFSRRNEIEADFYSCELTGNSKSMITTLIKLSKDNLSNLHPHPLYAAFHYSHPPVLERIRIIREKRMVNQTKHSE
ncbi:MAG: M48 family peptidase [wastewater metagenome]|nr:M48 family peptidase [Candidatus Loosdrechtia aerotolerans]